MNTETVVKFKVNNETQVKRDKELFKKLLTISRSREVNLQDVLSFEHNKLKNCRVCRLKYQKHMEINCQYTHKKLEKSRRSW